MLRTCVEQNYVVQGFEHRSSIKNGIIIIVIMIMSLIFIIIVVLVRVIIMIMIIIINSSNGSSSSSINNGSVNNTMLIRLSFSNCLSTASCTWCARDGDTYCTAQESCTEFDEGKSQNTEIFETH